MRLRCVDLSDLIRFSQNKNHFYKVGDTHLHRWSGFARIVDPNFPILANCSQKLPIWAPRHAKHLMRSTKRSTREDEEEIRNFKMIRFSSGHCMETDPDIQIGADSLHIRHHFLWLLKHRMKSQSVSVFNLMYFLVTHLVLVSIENFDLFSGL